tara:strand:- start:102 stop:626 length:525 start_codon:yes stop_codon:yes gene_type:complete
MNFKLIVATCKNNGIGINNTLPWKYGADLKHFSKITKGQGNNAIVMGRKTWDSLNHKPLIGRDHFILSKNLEINEYKNNVFIHSFKDIMDLCLFCKKKTYDCVWIIGGQQIYDQFLKTELIDECVITKINKDYNCDVFFPSLDDNWYMTKLESLTDASNNIIDDIAVVYMKKKT